MATKAKRTRDTRTAAEVTLQHLKDADAVLSYLMHDTLERINAIEGSAVVVHWSDAASAERVASDLLDILQRTFYSKAEGDEAKAREMALAAARLNLSRAFADAPEIAPYFERDGVNLLDIENEDLTVPELRRKVEIAREAGETDVERITRREIARRVPERPSDGGFVCASCRDRVYDANAATCPKCKGKQCAQCCRGTFLH